MDTATYFKFVAALALVLALIALIAWALKRVGLAGQVARPGRVRRLAVVETLAIDAKHRAVLLRRDGVEHLVVIGATGIAAVETSIPALAPEAVTPA